MKKVLVTGAAGFIGSNMVKMLLDFTDIEVFAIDNLQAGDRIYNSFIAPLEEKHKERLHFFKGNINNIENKFEYFFKLNKNKIDAVFHFAATPSVPYSVEYPLETNDNNVSNTLVLLEWCVKHKIRRFVFSSSSAIYGDTDVFPTPETSEIYPKSPYALQKRVIEEYCKLYSELYGLDTVCLRYFNVYGPNQYSENAYSTVICAWIKGAIAGNQLRLDGTGKQSRDFVFVQDVCKANLLVANCEKKFSGDIFNVGSGKNDSLLRILDIVKSISSISDIDHQKSRAGDVHKTHADIKKISALGYKPSVNINDGVQKTYFWYKRAIKQ